MDPISDHVLALKQHVKHVFIIFVRFLGGVVPLGPLPIETCDSYAIEIWSVKDKDSLVGWAKFHQIFTFKALWELGGLMTKLIVKLCKACCYLMLFEYNRITPKGKVLPDQQCSEASSGSLSTLDGRAVAHFELPWNMSIWEEKNRASWSADVDLSTKGLAETARVWDDKLQPHNEWGRGIEGQPWKHTREKLRDFFCCCFGERLNLQNWGDMHWLREATMLFKFGATIHALPHQSVLML